MVIFLCLDEATDVSYLSIRYNHILMSDREGRGVADTLHQTILEVLDKPGHTVGDVDVCSKEDIHRMHVECSIRLSVDGGTARLRPHCAAVS